MAEGLLPNSNNSRKKSKQKGFDVFRQPTPRLIAERHGNLTRPFSTSDSDSSTKSANSGALSGKANQAANPGVGFKSSAHDISNAPGDINEVAKRFSDFSGAGGSYVTGSLREPVVAVDHVTSSQTLLPRDSPSNFLNTSASNLQLRKLSDSHVVSVPSSKLTSVSSGDTREPGFSSAGGRSAFSPVVGVSFSGGNSGTQPPPRVPPRVPLQQKPFGKHHKRNSTTCSISGSNASINSAASTPAPATGGDQPTVSLNELPILGAHTQGSARATSSSAAVSPFMPPIDTTRHPESLSLANLHLSPSSTSNSDSRDGKTTPQNTTLDFKTTTSESPSPSSVKLTSPLQINSNNSISAQVSKTTTNLATSASTKQSSNRSLSGTRRKTIEEIDFSNENNQSFNDFKNDNSVAQLAATAAATTGAILKSSKPTSSGKVRISLEQPSNSDKQRGNQDINGRNKIRALLESGKLSHDTSQLFRSLPIFRSNYQTAKLAQMTQSLNRNNFQFLPSSFLSEASQSANENFTNNNKQYGDANQSTVKSTTVLDDQVQVSSQSLMDQIYALDKQRALLLTRVQKLKEKQKFYGQRFASLRQKETNCNSEKDMESVKTEERSVCSEMERELGMRTEADFQAKIESDSSSLQRMDQQLIQLFELFYLLEQSNSNNSQSSTDTCEESNEPSKSTTDSKAPEVVHFGDSSSQGNAVLKHPETISDSNNGSSPDPVSYDIQSTPRLKERDAHSNTSIAAPTQQVEMMFQFLASFNDKNYEEMSRTFLLMSSAPETCLAMRQAGCLPLLIQLIHCELDATASMSSTSKNNNQSTEVANMNLHRIKKKTRRLKVAKGDANSSSFQKGTQDASQAKMNEDEIGEVQAADEGTEDTVESILCLMEELDANSSTVRQRASESLHNIIHSQAPSKTTNRDIKMLSYLSRIRAYCETICREYCEYLVSMDKQENSSDEALCGEVSSSKRAGSQKEGVTFGTKLCSVGVQLKRVDGIVDLVSTLTKLSFIAEELISFQTLGGIPAICELLMVDVGLHHILSKHQQQINSFSSNSSLQMSALCDLSMKLRRHIAELLTNMTHKNQAAKSTLTHYSEVMKCLASQLQSHREDLVHVTADLIRNLAWMPEKSQMMVLRDLNVSILLAEAFVMINNFMALRAISSALWNLSSNCMENRVEICSVGGCLDKMVSLLKLDLSSNSQSLHVNHQVVYNCSGLLHSLCGHIATRTELREQLRNANVFEVLLDLCKRQDLPDIVINAVSCLYFLSTRDKADQEILWLLGAPNILKDLSNSASVKISSAAHQTRKNLMQAKSHLRGLQSHNAAGSPTFHNSSSQVNRINDGIRKPGEGSDSPNQLGVAKLVRPAVMFDDPSQPQANFASPAINQFGNQSATSGYATSESGGQNYPSGFEAARNGFNTSTSSAVASSENGLTNNGHIGLNKTNGDIAWLKEAYQRRQENNVHEQRGTQHQAETKANFRTTLHSSRKAALMHQMDAGNESFSSYQEQLAVDRQRRAAVDLQRQQHQKVNQRQFDEQDKRSVTSSQGDDEVVNYTLKYYGTDSQGDLDEEGGGMMDEDQPNYTYTLAANQIEESEYYEQPTDFSVRFPENDAMSTYEELDFSVNSSMSRNIMNNEINVISNVVGPQAPCFEDVNYEHNEEHNDSMNETLQPQGVINSPAGVYRQVRFKPAIKETVTDISTSSPHGVMLESERRVALPRGPLESVSSSVHQEQDSEGNISKKGSATGTPLMGDTPLMFSRRSSVSSLGDFETQSITSNSNFASEQGSRAISGAVSPSDIPDSPNEMMMQSRIPQNQGTISQQQQQQQQVDSGRNFGNPISSVSRTQLNTTSVRDHQQQTHLENARQQFVSEPPGNDFSCASSLSALTFDDEPKVKELAKNFQQFTTYDESTGQQQEVVNLNIPRRLNLKETVNISQEIDCNNEAISRDWAKQLNKSAQPTTNEQTLGRSSDDDDSLLLDDDDDVNLRGSNEEDHSVLMEAISSGMPELKPRRTSSKKTNSQSYLKQGSSKLTGKTGMSMPTSSYSSEQSNQPYTAKGRQSPGLIRSTSGRSLNSVGSGRKSPGAGPKVSSGSTYGSARPQNTYMDLYMRRMSQTESGVSSPRGTGGNVDTVKVYQTEGTPLNFSTRTSLSDLSVADDVLHSSDLYLTQTNNLQPSNGGASANLNGKRDYAPSSLHPEKSHRLKSWAINSPGAGSVSKYSSATGGFDSPKVYNVEGTPASYSRNDSLSSLSCDEGGLDDSALGTVPSSRPPPHPQFLRPSLEVPASTTHLHRKNSPGKSGSSKIPVANTYRRRSSNGSSDVEKPDSSSSGSLERKNRDIGQPVPSGQVAMVPSESSTTGSKKQTDVSIVVPAETDLSKSFDDEQEDYSNRRRSIGELSNASSGGDVGLEDRALLNECIYSAMPSSARKSSKSSKNQLQMKTGSLETGSTELDNFESNGSDETSRRRLNYP